MIGQHVVATLWSVQYSYEAPRTENTQHFVTGETLILTADPTGDDLRQVVERFVMGAKPKPGYSRFLLTVVRRLNDVTGLGQLVAPDRGWPAGLDVGAVVLEAGTRQLAAIGDLSKALAFTKAENAVLRAQLEALQAEVTRLDAELAAVPEPPDLPPAPDVERAQKLAAGAEQQLTQAHQAIAKVEQQIEQARASAERVTALEGERAAAEAELADWTRLAADLGRDGLQAMVIDGAIPELNDTANQLLHAAFGPRFTLDVRTQSADAKGRRLLETLDVWVIDTGTEQHKGREGLIETFSGGEKTILAEALSLALTQLACRLSGAERPTLIRDESAGQLSEGNAPIWMAMLRRAADLIGADRILFVNHDRQTWDLADARIEVRS